jgi:hypothetical protein
VPEKSWFWIFITGFICKIQVEFWDLRFYLKNITEQEVNLIN